ncbi:RnfABCDGE type electron transport complex subunit D [Uliginosibacterium gangwonense]|uniref:RnfABCDGE type electron transport complex subunit D n=1 Tax=Uliginosibacterium gangwonense TaxID=392736 RepID=UPI0003630492|nr:RnfABCDGE type electron transport complex subunit D [Uliginosibacterium gangwonense]
MNTHVINLNPVAAPHAQTGESVSAVMLKVLLALVPATFYAFWLFGAPSFWLWLITIASAAAGEAACLRMGKREVMPQLRDGSAILTGWLLALSLPPWAPWWIGVVGGLFATTLGKQVFGGIGNNLFNPAMIARIALLVSFPVQMTYWVVPNVAPNLFDGLLITLGHTPIPDAMSSATLLGHAKTDLARGVDLLHTSLPGHAFNWVGARVGSLGETSAWLIAAGGVALIFMRVISWHIPVAMLLALAVPAAIGHHENPARYLDATTHLMSGGAMLGAFFIATDYVTSPNTKWGQLVFGAGCGLLTWVIRTYGGYPEGVAFAVLLMNALTPAIDRLVKPRVYGRTYGGKPISAEKGKRS